MIGALLQLLRRVPVLSAEGLLVGRELGGATVGLVGMAPAARPLAQTAGRPSARAWSATTRRCTCRDGLWKRWKVEPLGLRELMEQSDARRACMLTYFTRYHGLLGERFLPSCKPNQVLVSIAHSSLFDEMALAEALGSAAAWPRRGSTAWSPACSTPGRPLHDVDTLQVTPRVASTTRESRIRSAWAVARRIDELLSATPARGAIQADGTRRPC